MANLSLETVIIKSPIELLLVGNNTTVLIHPKCHEYRGNLDYHACQRVVRFFDSRPDVVVDFKNFLLHDQFQDIDFNENVDFEDFLLNDQLQDIDFNDNVIDNNTATEDVRPEEYMVTESSQFSDYHDSCKFV